MESDDEEEALEDIEGPDEVFSWTFISREWRWERAKERFKTKKRTISFSSGPGRCRLWLFAHTYRLGRR